MFLRIFAKNVKIVSFMNSKQWAFLYVALIVSLLLNILCMVSGGAGYSERFKFNCEFYVI